MMFANAYPSPGISPKHTSMDLPFFSRLRIERANARLVRKPQRKKLTMASMLTTTTAIMSYYAVSYRPDRRRFLNVRATHAPDCFLVLLASGYTG